MKKAKLLVGTTLKVTWTFLDPCKHFVISWPSEWPVTRVLTVQKLEGVEFQQCEGPTEMGTRVLSSCPDIMVVHLNYFGEVLSLWSTT